MKRSFLHKLIREELTNILNEAEHIDYTKKPHGKWVMQGNELIFSPPLDYTDILEVNYQTKVFIDNFEKMTQLKVKSLKLEYDGKKFKLFLEHGE